MVENTEKFTLNDMPDDQAVEIFKAWRRSDPLEFYTHRGEWEKGLTSVLDEDYIYRIPARKPSFNNWHLLPEWARYIAQDEDGDVIIYENEPARSKKTWLLRDGEASSITGFHLGYDPGTGGWENSMIEKPEGV